MKVIDFWATWCSPCKMLSPLLEESQAEYGFEFEAIDVDADPETAKSYGVMSMPTVVALRSDGSEIARFVGAQSRAFLHEFFTQAAADE